MVGTIRKNKRALPPEFVNGKNRPVATSMFAYRDNCTLVSYIPKKGKNVLLISTMHDDDSISEVTGKPEIVMDYNCTKGGVDTVDQLCANYNCACNAQRWPMVLQLPEVLCIHLKRFRHELMFSSKISSAVSFPLKGLDMRPYLHTDCISKVTTYELFSVICHHGTAGGGHYTCFALNSGQWYEFDDQYVTKVTPDKVQTCEAYVLFYQKIRSSADTIRDKAEKISESCGENVQRTYISRQWINRFYYCAEPGPIDNSDFLCQHGAISPDRDLDIDKLAMVVPYDVYDYLFKKFGGCPPFTNLGICPACRALHKRLLMEMETFMQVSREAQNQDAPHTHYLSTSWYTQWHNFVQKRNQEPPGPIDNTKINLNQLDLNEAADVPECIWNFFYNIYGGGPEIRIKPPSIQRTGSEDSIPENTDDTVFNIPVLKRGRTESNASVASSSGAPEFVIPTLKKDKKDVKPMIDKTMYSHGEPMETTQMPNNGVNGTDNEFGGTQEENCVETGISKNESDIVQNHLSNNVGKKLASAVLTNVDDDIDEEEGEEIRNNKRHRRRRKNLVNSSL
ncbi:hypothetical protein NQ314_012282 [Rhamnusium bicolor]|uniref:Ubiquitinyl hydrolase 1 n=1 Tax=Rhamnusium bicolor TaxID=1586634 RepID=A0AAV8XC02_9CUCU|nr:hypothetical protein NQ314_012282 [Rhamnusium bicolor]